MLKSVSPFVLLAIAAAPVVTVEAAPLPTPTFNCFPDPMLGGTITWDDGASTTPMLSYASSPDSFSLFTPLQCTDGQFGEPLARKSGEGQKDFLKVTMTEVFITSLQTPEIKVGQQTVFLGNLTVHRTMWDITLDFAGESGGSNFFGITFDSLVKFVVADAQFSFDDGQFSFSAPNPEGRISLSDTRQAPVPVPGTLLLLGTGLVGIGAAMRRRRGW